MTVFAALIAFVGKKKQVRTWGVQYLLLHTQGEPRWWYPGWIQKLCLHGRFRGAPRWPMRLAGHDRALRVPHSRDGALPRYCRWRSWGAGGLGAFPVLLGSLLLAYNREQHIIRTKSPLSVERVGDSGGPRCDAHEKEKTMGDDVVPYLRKEKLACVPKDVPEAFHR